MPDSALRRDPGRTMFGFEQEAWLFDQLKRSDARWNILAQQFAIVERQAPDKKTGQYVFGNDGWDAFRATRERVLQALAGVSNPSVIGGDSHIFMAADLRIKREGQLVAPAFVGGSISSTAQDLEGIKITMRENPDRHFGENTVRGYTLVEAAANEMMFTMRAMIDARDPETDARVLARFVMENGRPGARRASSLQAARPELRQRVTPSALTCRRLRARRCGWDGRNSREEGLLL